jgi:hypothetical protein
MKILIYANRVSTGALTSLLDKLVIETKVSALEKVEDVLAMTPNACEDIDIAFVDASLRDAETAYQHLRHMCVIPVVMLVDRDEADWEKLSGMGLCGYLCLTSDTDIVVSSLKAIMRRLPGYSKAAVAV